MIRSEQEAGGGGGGDRMRWENQLFLGWTRNRQAFVTHLSLRHVCDTRYSSTHMFGVLFVRRLQQILLQHDLSGVAGTLVLVKRGSETDHEDGLSQLTRHRSARSSGAGETTLVVNFATFRCDLMARDATAPKPKSKASTLPSVPLASRVTHFPKEDNKFVLQGPKTSPNRKTPSQTIWQS